MRSRALFLALALAVAAEGKPKQPLRILFVGNSLTYSNDLPSMIARIGALDDRSITTKTIAFPNYSLEDHLRERHVQRALLESRWDVVVLQQGPSSLAESRRQLIRDVKELHALPSVQTGAVTAVLMVWPPRERQHVWRDVAEAHRLAAVAIDGMLIPAGAVLRSAMTRDPSLGLLGADGFHPTLTGTYLVALTAYRVLVGPLPAALGKPGGARKVAGPHVESRREALQMLFEVATELDQR